MLTAILMLLLGIIAALTTEVRCACDKFVPALPTFVIEAVTGLVRIIVVFAADASANPLSQRWGIRPVANCHGGG
jgi:hypothetical protein